MSITAQVNELKSITAELKTLTAKTKRLKARKALLENEVSEFIARNNLPGVKHQGMEVRLEKRKKRLNKTKAEQESDAVALLREEGVSHPEELLSRLLEARRGKQVEVDKLMLGTPKKRGRKKKEE